MGLAAPIFSIYGPNYGPGGTWKSAESDATLLSLEIQDGAGEHKIILLQHSQSAVHVVQLLH